MWSPDWAVPGLTVHVDESPEASEASEVDQVQPAKLTVGSVTVTEVRVTSPMFSTITRYQS